MKKLDSLLHKKIAGALWAGAIGDALGGPIEGLTYREIEARYGVVQNLMPYAPEAAPQGTAVKLYGDTRKVGDHGPFTLQAGSYTD
ncbi:MAG TPA: ADP-ribosylglycohydrolase family protein, partial [Anaerolineae bacterium]|nr:ADP-ribosylglycohydrolase family protein [Anaerolineae bacterium]